MLKVKKITYGAIPKYNYHQILNMQFKKSKKKKIEEIKQSIIMQN